MAETATAEYYTKQNKYDKEKLKTDYEQYLADLATKYGISQDQLNSNLESRGILRSGEAGTAQARLGAANEAAITTAGTNYQYNVDTADTNLLKQLAGLQSSTPATAPTPATTHAPAASPAEDKPQTYDFSKVDFAGLGKIMEANKKPKPVDLSGVNWNALAGFGGSTGATPATRRITPPSARNR
jgi:hypothetical protein